MLYKGIENINGSQLAYVRTCDWEEDIILFFHGFCGSKGYFPDHEFSDKPCIVSFDRPGVGNSSVEKYYTMESFLKNVYDVLIKHGVRSVRLIGHSGGGYYAQVFAGMYPDVVKSMSLVSSMVSLNCPKTRDIVNDQWKSIVNLCLKHKIISRLYFMKMASGIVKGYEKQLASNMEKLPPDEKQFMEENHDMVKEVVMSAVANKGSGVCYDAYALCLPRDEVCISNEIPVYVWHGTDDADVPVSVVDYYKETYTVRNLHIIENAGHMLYLPYWKEIIEEMLL